jgi:hypothetical protein
MLSRTPLPQEPPKVNGVSGAFSYIFRPFALNVLKLPEIKRCHEEKCCATQLY